MSEFNAAKFLSTLQGGPDSVDKSFEALSKELPEAEFKAAIDSLEKNFLDEMVDEFRGEIQTKGAKALKQQLRKEAEYNTGEEAVASGQAVVQIVFHINKTKGEEASPFLKAFVRAAEKLTDRQYNTVSGLMKPVSAVIDAVAKDEAELKRPRPNPFRQKPPAV